MEGDSVGLLSTSHHHQPGGLEIVTSAMVPASGPAGESTMTALFETLCVSTAHVVDSILRENPDMVHFKGWRGLSLLHRICMRGDAEAIAVVLRHGADPNGTTEGGETPLHYSSRHGRMPPLSTLMRAGANPHAVDNAGHGCLHFAAQGGSINVMAYLNEVHSADYGCLSLAKQTPVHVAAIHGHWQAAMFLLRKEVPRCSVTEKDIMGNTALHLAACYGHLSICWQILIAARNSSALLSSVNRQNQTALDLAKMGSTPRHIETQKWLAHFGKTKGSISLPRYTQYFNFLLPSALCCVPLFAEPFLWPSSGIQPVLYLIIIAFLGWWIVRQDHRLQHPSRLPNSARAGIFALGIFGNLVCYFLILKPYVVMDWLMNWASWTAVFFFILAIGSFVAKEPGRYRYETTNNADGGRDWSPVLNGTPGATFCDVCELIQSAGIQHCRVCGVCYYDLEHHCIFMMRCITSSNGRHFLFLLITIIIGCMCYMANVMLFVSDVSPSQPYDERISSSSDQRRMYDGGSTRNDSIEVADKTADRDTLWQMMIDQTFVLVVFVLDVLGIVWCSVLAHHQATDSTNWPTGRRAHSHHHVRVMGV